MVLDDHIAFHLLQDPVFSNDVVPCIGCGSSTHGQASVGVAMCAGFKAGNGAKANGIGWQEQCAPTLGAAPSGTNQVPAVCAKVFDARGNDEYQELYPTLQAKPNGGQSLNFSGVVRVRYNVRRLTPTECARLQGFPDNWGHPDRKEDFYDEEYSFWLNVRNTYAAVNGKAVRQYTRQQMLAWYNKLHTDSAEYKMWGNGIALPCALYVMQGVKAFYQTRE